MAITICAIENNGETGGPIPSGLNVAVLCLTDRQFLDSDCFGARVAQDIQSQGHHLADLKAAFATPTATQGQIQMWLDRGDVDAILIVDELEGAPTGALPTIILVSDHGETENFTRLLKDGDNGYVEMIDVRAARRWAA